MQPKMLEKDNKSSRWQDIIKMKAETSEMEAKKTTQESTNLRAGSMRNKQGWQTLGLTNQKNERIQINKIKNKQGNITTDKRNLEYYKRVIKKFIRIKFENLKEVDELLESSKLSKLQQSKQTHNKWDWKSNKGPV